MTDDLPTIEALKAEHEQLEGELKQLAELAEQLESGEGFDELDRLAQVMRFDLDHHFPAEEQLTRALLGEDDPLFTELKLQHASLTTHYRTLLKMIDDIRSDVLVDRALFMKTMRGVMLQMRAHLEAEDRLLLPRLAKG